LRHAGVMLTSPSSLPLWLTAKAKARPLWSWPPSRRAPQPFSASLPSTYPTLPAAIKSRLRNPLDSPNPSRLGGSIPLPTHPHVGEEEKWGEKEVLEAARGNAVRRKDRSRPWEEPAPQSSSAPASTASTSLRRRLLPSRQQVAPPFFTNACTTTRGHQGENELPPALYGRPSLRAEGERDARTAQPRVMPAIEPGWDDFLTGAAAFTNARAPSAYLSYHFWPSCATTVLAAVMARRRRVRVHARARAGTSPLHRRAPQHAHALAGKARLGLWPFFLCRTSPRCCAPVGRAAMASPWRLASRTQS
jgi:hypothetical protein